LGAGGLNKKGGALSHNRPSLSQQKNYQNDSKKMITP